MSHDIEQKNGLYYAAFVAEHGLPWHDRETDCPKLPRGCTVYELGKAAHLDQNLNRVKLYYAQGREWSGWDALERTDGLQVAVVRDTFTYPQPIEVGELLDVLVQRGLAEHSAAGWLREGTRMWWCIKVVGERPVVRADGTVDQHEWFINCSQAFDATRKLWLNMTGVRTVCRNTEELSHFIAEDLGYEVPHRSGIAKRVETIRGGFEKLLHGIDNSIKVYEQLDRERFSVSEFCDYRDTIIDSVYGSIAAAQESLRKAERENNGRSIAAAERRIERRETELGNLTNEFGNEECGNHGRTKYDGLQAVTAWLDHSRARRTRAKDAVEKQLRWLDEQLAGETRRIRRRAAELLVLR